MEAKRRSVLTKVSVVIPCYNSADYVGATIESALAQTHDDIELILVDNGSTDKTLELLNRYQEDHPGRISVFQETQKGAPAARNKGLEQASGVWIQFLDSDDQLLPGKIARQLALAETNKADFITGSFLRVKETDDKEVYPIADSWVGLIKSRLGRTSSNLWHRTAVLEVEGWNNTITSSQEYDLMFRLLQAGFKATADMEVNTRINYRDESVSKTANEDRLKEIFNNRVQLRYEIMQYLEQSEQLDERLVRARHEYIYKLFSVFRPRLRSYLREKSTDPRCHIPLAYKLPLLLNSYWKDPGLMFRSVGNLLKSSG